jgi:asparagine synthase (glutamine-hydrolysing)
MSGIFGIINHTDVKSLIHKMIDSQTHRGPDATGIYADEVNALGHNRLSIIDLSESGNQPL